MKRMFTFDPKAFTEEFAAQGFVYIPNGLTPDFYDLLVRQADEYLEKNRLKDFALGDKQQALYEFPQGGDFYGELRQSIGAVAKLKPEDLVLSERHFKAYDAKAAPKPLPHKDRFASEVSVGFSVHVPEGSTLVLYPWDDLGPNPFNASAELRASLPPERLPENLLKGTKRIEIPDRPGDVIIFLGNAIWHCRENPASTTMLYLKLNSFNCDPLGEDARTPLVRGLTKSHLELSDWAFEELTPVLGRRVDYFHRRYNHNQQEVPGVVLWGEKHVSVDDHEFRALRALDGKRTVREIAEAMGHGNDQPLGLRKIRRLAERGILDLVARAEPVNGHAKNGVAREAALAGV